jgi:NAD kinase
MAQSITASAKNPERKLERNLDRKIILIKRETRLEELTMRFNTVAQAKFYVERLNADFSEYVREHDVYKATLQQVSTHLETFGRVQVLDRAYLPNMIFADDDIVVVVGQDGLVANTLKYVSAHVVIAVNPDRTRYDGVLLPFVAGDLGKILPEVLAEKRPFKEITLAHAALNDGQELYAVNDFYIGQKTHVSSRYQIEHSGTSERQSSSGIIVSTGLGSTGWMKSVINGAQRIASEIGQDKSNTTTTDTIKTKNKSKSAKASGTDLSLAWNSDFLYYSVREPFPSRATSTNLIFGKVSASDPLKVRSAMAENGVIYSDGIEADFLPFNAGIEATICTAARKARLAV